MMKLLVPLFAALMLSLSPAQAHGDDHDGGIEISNAWARKTSRTVSAAIYLTVKNGGHHLEEITGASSDLANRTMIHRSFEEDGVMRMEHAEGVPIAPGETFKLEPGGYHIMLMGLSAPLKEGDAFPITLSFKEAGDVEVIVEVTGIMGRQ